MWKSPPLCHDDRLKPAGACRICLVEVDGVNLMQPACHTQVTPGMVVRTNTSRVDRNRQFILSLHLADTVQDRAGRRGQQSVQIVRTGGHLRHSWRMGVDRLTSRESLPRHQSLYRVSGRSLYRLLIVHALLRRGGGGERHQSGSSGCSDDDFHGRSEVSDGYDL